MKKKEASQLAVRDGNGRLTSRGSLEELWKNKMLYLMTLPAAVWVFIFCYIPMYGILIAFKDFNFKLGIWGSEWVGLKNFRFLFNYKGVGQIFFNTIALNVLFIVTGTIFSVGLALVFVEIKNKVYNKVVQTKLTMAMVANEDYDLMFCGSWHGLTSFMQDGNFADLSAYFNNDNFPGLKAAFSPNFVDAMTSYIRQPDGTFTKGIYSINLASFYEDSRGFMYREDLRQKYNCDPITGRESLFAYLDTVTANEPDMIGVSLWNFFYIDSPVYSGKHDGVYSQDSTNIFGDQTRAFVGLSADGKTVQNVVFPGGPQEEWDKMPSGYQYDFITEYAITRTDWNKYLNPNRGGTDTVERDAVIEYCPLTEFESKVKEAQEKIPGSEYGYYVYEDAQRNKEEGAVICDMVTNNWLVVPEWSENVDAVMYFLDWMFGTQEAHDTASRARIGSPLAPRATSSWTSPRT